MKKKGLGNSYKIFLVWLCLIISVGITGCDTESFNANEKEFLKERVVQKERTTS